MSILQRTACCVALIAGTLAAGLAPAAAEITGLAIYPPDVQLQTSADFQQVIAVATRNDGVTLDVTESANWQLSAPDIVRLDGSSLHPLADGQVKLLVQYQGRKAEVPVTVSDVKVHPAISFRKDVMPVLMRAGCNTGSCHGAARGKDGFRLSLFGYDPAGDYYRITREIGTRRINLAIPNDSLLIQKSVGGVTHTGGKRFSEGTPYHATLLRWLEAGAPDDVAEVAAVTSVEIFPPAAVLEGKGAKQRFIVRAHYSDGRSRDVTNLAVFLSNNDSAAPVDADGLVTAGARGEAFVTGRFETYTVGSQVLTLPADLKYEVPPITGNYIDQLVGAKLHKLRIVPSGICSDEEFLRRVTVDIIGQLPTAEQHAQFLADTSPDKRQRKVDELLTRKEFAEIWAMKWAELLMIRSSNRVSYKSAFLYNSWLTDQIARNVPLNQMVRELLSASGGTFENPAANFYEVERDTLKTAENVAQTFLGIRTQCAQCHNHPFDRWTMDDYYSFAAFFAQVGRKQGEDYREQIIYNRGSGEAQHFVDKRPMPPKFLGGEVADVKGKDRRAVLADWLTSPENPYFATSVGNRIWAHFFGIGIVEPVDDLRVTNPPSNPELFRALGEKLVEYNYDFKRIVSDICASQTYQRSSQPNPSNGHDERNFARARVRRIQAEMLLDCVSQVTDTQDKFRGLPLGARAVQIADGATTTYFLTTFGRAERESACACDVRSDPTLSQALHLINGSTVQGKIRSGQLVTRLLAEDKPPQDIIDLLYIRCFSRHPTADETQRLMGIVAKAESPEKGLEDVFWAILNSREFLFNH
jgi:hypothetical protein